VSGSKQERWSFIALLAESLKHFVAVEPRHIYIGNDEVYRFVSQDFQGVKTIDGGHRAEPSQMEAVAKDLSDAGFVVYDHYFCHVLSQPEVLDLTKPPMDFHKDFTK
jgi:hypothetical protein